MTIAALTTRAIYQGTVGGNTGPFPLAASGGTPIPIIDATEVFAYKWPSGGLRATLSQTGAPPDYSVALTPLAGGAVQYQSATIATALPLFTGDVLVIERVTTLQQLFDPLFGGPNQFQNYEAAWDRLTKIVQEHMDLLARTPYADNAWDGVTLNGAPRLNARGLRLGNLQAATNIDEAVTLAQLQSFVAAPPFVSAVKGTFTLPANASAMVVNNAICKTTSMVFESCTDADATFSRPSYTYSNGFFTVSFPNNALTDRIYNYLLVP